MYDIGRELTYRKRGLRVSTLPDIFKMSDTDKEKTQSFLKMQSTTCYGSLNIVTNPSNGHYLRFHYTW